MDIALVSSLSDPGGSTIHDALLSLLSRPHTPYPLEEHRLVHHRIEDRLIFHDRIDREVDADLIVFLSRHSSQKPVPVLTVHVTGNFGPAEFGGLERSLARAAPAWMRAVLLGLSRNAPPGYRVAYEVTHHGPTEVGTPSFFVEVGSTEREWRDVGAAAAVARSILCAEPGDTIPVVGFGGTHYAARQTHIALHSRAAFGHIVHSRDVPLLDRDLVSDMVERTGAVAAYIDRKSLPPAETRRLEQLLSREGIPTVPENDFIRMGNLSFDAYRKVQALAGDYAGDSNVTFHGTWPDGAPVPVDVPPDLLEEVLRSDSRAFIEGIENIPVARIVTPRSKAMPRFITVESCRERVLHHLISLCVNILRRGESTSIAGDSIVIRKRGFDAARAEALGVPRGPLFSRLMNGESVLAGDREVTPEMVIVTREKKIHIPGLEKYLWR
ncbi:MAG: D-aminoacyl-tRNA deacylase [Methanolinea sp.]|nr:D-aminoacyl-tRNA deacylase [Methanolinea sp.]